MLAQREREARLRRAQLAPMLDTAGENPQADAFSGCTFPDGICQKIEIEQGVGDALAVHTFYYEDDPNCRKYEYGYSPTRYKMTMNNWELGPPHSTDNSTGAVKLRRAAQNLEGTALPWSSAHTRKFMPARPGLAFFTMSDMTNFDAHMRGPVPYRGGFSDDIEDWSLRQQMQYAMEEAEHASHILLQLEVGTCVGQCHELARPKSDLTEIYVCALTILGKAEMASGLAAEIMRQQRFVAAESWRLRREAGRTEAGRTEDAFTTVTAREKLGALYSMLCESHARFTQTALAELRAASQHLDLVLQGPHGIAFANIREHYEVRDRVKFFEAKNIALATRRPVDHIVASETMDKTNRERNIAHQWRSIPTCFVDKNQEPLQMPPAYILKRLLYAFDINGMSYIRDLQTFSCMALVNPPRKEFGPIVYFVEDQPGRRPREVCMDATATLAPWRTEKWIHEPNAIFRQVMFNNELIEITMRSLYPFELVQMSFASKLVHQGVMHAATNWRLLLNHWHLFNFKKHRIVNDIESVVSFHGPPRGYLIEGKNFNYSQGSTGPYASYWDAAVFRTSLMCSKPAGRWCVFCLKLTRRVPSLFKRPVCNDCIGKHTATVTDWYEEHKNVYAVACNTGAIMHWANACMLTLPSAFNFAGHRIFKRTDLTLFAMQIKNIDRAINTVDPTDVRYLLGLYGFSGPHASITEPPVVLHCANFMDKPGFKYYETHREMIRGPDDTHRIHALYELYGNHDRMTTGRVFDFTKESIFVSRKEIEPYPNWPLMDVPESEELVEDEEVLFQVNFPFSVLLPPSQRGATAIRRECGIVAVHKFENYNLCEACYTRCMCGGPFNNRRPVAEVLNLAEDSTDDEAA